MKQIVLPLVSINTLLLVKQGKIQQTLFALIDSG